MVEAEYRGDHAKYVERNSHCGGRGGCGEMLLNGKGLLDSNKTKLHKFIEKLTFLCNLIVLAVTAEKVR